MRWRTRIIIALCLLVAASFAVVLIFAAGFATGSVLSEAGGRDRCTQAAGNWDDAKRLCVMPAPAAAVETSVQGMMYQCGNGTQFTLASIASDQQRFQVVGSTTTRTLMRTGTSTVYGDGTVSVALDGPDLRYENRTAGVAVGCTQVTTSTVSQ